MVAKVYFWLMIIFGCGCFTNQNALGLLDVPQINEAPDEVSNSSNELSTNDSSLDLIALKMRFKQQDNPYGEIYDLKNYAFVVSNNSRICPEQNCKFDIEETSLNPQPGTSRYGVSGTMKVDTGDVKKIFGIYSDFTPTEEREKNGQTIETVEGTFRIGKEPVNEAEFEYNINGTLVTDGKTKELSVQGIQCKGLQDDLNKGIDCNY